MPDGSFFRHQVKFVGRLALHQVRAASLCMGIFVLAEAGLLEGKRTTTHWIHAPAFRKRYPHIHLEEDKLFVVDGQAWTSAGMSAGVDLAWK